MLPEPGEIYLWQVHQSDFELGGLDEYRSWLSKEDSVRFHRLRFDRHKRQLLLGRVFLRTVLSRCAGIIAPRDWTFVYNERGKPAIDPSLQQEPFYFNLSHSQDRIVLAVSRHRNTGVDIEFNRRPRRVGRLVARFFSPLENNDLLRLPRAEQLPRFYQLWTLKEAYIKAKGLGLALPLDSFSFRFPRPEEIRFVTHGKTGPETGLSWRFWQVDWIDRYACAVALGVEDGTPVSRIRAWRMRGLDEFVETAAGAVRAGSQS